MTITIPFLGTLTLPQAVGAPVSSLPPVNAEARRVPQGLTLPGGPVVVHNPYKPGVNPAGHTMPPMSAPSRAGVPPSHLLGVAMRSLNPRPTGGDITIKPPVGATTVPPATGGPSHAVVALPSVPVLSGLTLPMVSKGTVPRWV
jgi:hypothetical protein